MALVLAADDLQHRVIIESLLETQSVDGDVTATPVTFATRWAEITSLGGRELDRARQIAATASVRIRMRYLAGVTPGMQVRYGSRVLGIESAQNTNEANIETVLLCSERT